MQSPKSNIQLQLNREEAEALHHALASYCKDSRLEIARTDNQKFRESLQARFDLLKSIEDRLARSVRNMSPGSSNVEDLKAS